MADTLYFSRDTKVYVEIGSTVWEIPVLDGFSFSQATNTSEITLNEMADSSGNSRRARQMFTDSYAPAEWSLALMFVHLYLLVLVRVRQTMLPIITQQKKFFGR